MPGDLYHNAANRVSKEVCEEKEPGRHNALEKGVPWACSR